MNKGIKSNFNNPVIFILFLAALFLLIAIFGGNIKFFGAEITSKSASKPVRIGSGILGLSLMIFGIILLNPPKDEPSKDDSLDIAIKNGIYQIKSVSNDKFFDIEDSSTEDGANVITHPKNDANNQKFRITKLEGKDYYEITNINSKKCLAIRDAITQSKADLIQWTCNNKGEQKFKFIPQLKNEYVIEVKHSNQILTVENNEIRQDKKREENPSNSQLFEIKKDVDTPISPEGN